MSHIPSDSGLNGARQPDDCNSIQGEEMDFDLSDKDVSKTPDQLLVASKAYAVIASLRTAEEVELHLA